MCSLRGSLVTCTSQCEVEANNVLVLLERPKKEVDEICIFTKSGGSGLVSLEILPFLNFAKFSFWTMTYSPWGLKIELAQNVHASEICMCTMFGGHSLSGFRDLLMITGYYWIGRTLRKDDELVSEAGIKSNSKLMLLGRKVRLFVVLNCLLSCFYAFNGYYRLYNTMLPIIFALLYFHKFCQFCSVTKLDFTKVLPCYTFCVAHVDH